MSLTYPVGLVVDVSSMAIQPSVQGFRVFIDGLVLFFQSLTTLLLNQITLQV